jgi:phosphoribosyl-ATP pyrophosphohydrolase
VIVALDSRDGEVLTHGWRQGSGTGVLERIQQVRDLCGGFLITFVEREGRLAGTDLERAAMAIEAAAPATVTIAGGITTPEEIAELDRLGADAQVGMALYTGQLTLASSITALMRSDRPDGLWPTVVVDEFGTALGLVYSSPESLERAIEDRRGVYQSRSRGVWLKGETSGAIQDLLAVDVDCDRDTLLFTVRQHDPGFCHLGTTTCWGQDHALGRLARRLDRIAKSDDAASNTKRLLADPALLTAKLTEEATELARAGPKDDVIHEAADLLYFLTVRVVAAGVDLADVLGELDRRELRTTRRPMTSKEGLR